MTNPPYTTGPAHDPNLPPRQPGGAAVPPAANPAGNPQSFQYRPHDPYGSYEAGRQSGPVLPPAPTFRQRWGIHAKDDRPRQVTVMLQSLWIYLATATVVVIVGAIMAAVAFSTLGFLYSVVLGLVSAVICLVLIWAVAREQLGRFGSHHPRTTLYIGLGVLGLNAFLGVFSFLTLVPALAQAAAVLLVPRADLHQAREGVVQGAPGEPAPRTTPAARPGATAPSSWAATDRSEPPARGARRRPGMAQRRRVSGPLRHGCNGFWSGRRAGRTRTAAMTTDPRRRSDRTGRNGRGPRPLRRRS